MCVCSCPDAYSGDMSICVCNVFLLLLMSSVKISMSILVVLMNVRSIPMSVYLLCFLLS